MDRRLAENTEEIRFRVDATRCDGQGVCAIVAPEIFELDRYGLAYVVPGSERAVSDDGELRARGLEADAMCPRDAIREEPVRRRPVLPAPDVALASSGPARRLLGAHGDGPEPLDRWRRAGGFGAHPGPDVLAAVEAAGLLGHGGAGYPAAAKWQRLGGSTDPVVVMNGAEREPGTLKDRHLLSTRPALVLDGLRLAMAAVGARLGVAAFDEESVTEHDAFTAVVAEASARGLLGDVEIRTHKVPTAYIAGEETALLSVIEGGRPLPRLRPPFPSDRGVWGRPTLVQNVETLAQVALVMALGVAEFRGQGTAEAPGTGLFSVGPFGGPYHVVECAYGTSLRELLAGEGLLDGARAVLVGGYAGGLLAPDQFDTPLLPATLVEAGAALGTKAVQVVGAERCPVGVAAEIVGYFGAETADQCPPCSRGLPDMAQLLRDIEAGTGGGAAVAELGTFMGTLTGRGVCGLPDGAARVVLSVLTRFADEIEQHTVSGCPQR